MGTMKILWWHFGNIWYDDLPISTNPAKTLFGIVHMRHIRFWTNWDWTNDMALGRKHHISWSAHWGAYVRWNTMAARWNISTPKSWTRTVFVSSDVWFMARTFLGYTGDTVYWSCSVMGSQWKSPFLMFRLTTRSFGLPHLFTLQLWLDSWEITLRNPLASVAMNHHTFQ